MKYKEPRMFVPKSIALTSNNLFKYSEKIFKFAQEKQEVYLPLQSPDSEYEFDYLRLIKLTDNTIICGGRISTTDIPFIPTTLVGFRELLISFKEGKYD